MKFEYITTKARVNWKGADFRLEVEVGNNEMDINELGQQGWELMGFFPDIHAIGDIRKITRTAERAQFHLMKNCNFQTPN